VGKLVGRLKTRPHMRPFNSFLRTVCYCIYKEGAHPFRKQTAGWTNYDWTPRLVCTNETPCPDKAVTGKHMHHAQQGAPPGLRKTLPSSALLLLARAPQGVGGGDGENDLVLTPK